MNIFAVDPCPRASARALRDNHVVKMTLESVQILCAVLWRAGQRAPYRATHLHHPCVVWASATRSNAAWLVVHARELAHEYTRRYGKRHASEAVLDAVAESVLACCPAGPLTPFAQAMPPECTRPDAHEAYRAYYREHKATGPAARWTRAERPAWL